MYLYTYWPYGNTRNQGQHLFAAFKTRQKAAEYAILQLAGYVGIGEYPAKKSKAKTKASGGILFAPQPALDFAPLWPEPAHEPQDINDDGVVNMDHVMAPEPVLVNDPIDWGADNGDLDYKPRKTKYKPIDHSSSKEFAALKKEIAEGQNYRTYDNAMRLIGQYEAYMASRGAKSVLHTIQEVKVIQFDAQ
jgi:hypothetical protein